MFYDLKISGLRLKLLTNNGISNTGLDINVFFILILNQNLKLFKLNYFVCIFFEPIIKS